jgi:SAM-dependent methyltransferase
MARTPGVADVWVEGSAYDAYVGRWSRLVAREFVAWLGVPARGAWLDVGCGAGALTGTIVERANPRWALGLDRSEGFVRHARSRVLDGRALFQVGDARALPVAPGCVDAAVSGLVLNFVPEPAGMVVEMARACRPGGTVALYVWDYAGGMELIRRFWDEATTLDPTAASLDEAVRFPVCAPGPLRQLLEGAGLSAVEVRSVDVLTAFRDFDDLWSPFLGGQGPAPSYLRSLEAVRRADLRERLRARMPVSVDGTIRIGARAWAARASAPA